ncbi:MAG TPA: TetR/AcrR family transcriptional regulator [Flavisolibacter sp.]|jgi:AcrR family transcriptional regulator|nr:TetR/AcrR family transcriptional regulator [Flavisolibacter sp.]
MDPKERILIKTHELFNRYGIRSVSMDDIAAQLGMSKKTLYQYYADKDELVNEVFGSIVEENKMHCIEFTSKGENAIHEIFMSFNMIEEILTEMNPSVLFDMQKYHPSAFKKFEEYRNNFLYKMILENLKSGISEGLYRDDFDIEILTRYRLYSIMLSFNSDIFPTNKNNLVYIEHQLLEHFLYGLATPKGQKLIQKYKNQRTKNKTR